MSVTVGGGREAPYSTQDAAAAARAAFGTMLGNHSLVKKYLILIFIL
jgi:hypothetical protein